MSMPRRIGLITVTYNSGDVLEDFLASFREAERITGDDLLLYVVDNASTDDTRARLKERARPSVRVIESAENMGVARGNNAGLRAALDDGCDAVVLINNDVLFEPRLVADLVDCVDLEHAAVPVIEASDPPGTLWFVAGSVSRWRAFAVTHHDMGKPVGALPARPAGTLMQYAPTCCMALDARTFARVGLMDEDFFVYGDDVDFCLRMARAGIGITLQPQLRLIHKASSLTGGALSDFGCRHITRGQVLLSRKHLGLAGRVWSLLYLLAYILARVAVGRDSPAMARHRFAGLASGFLTHLTTPASGPPIGGDRMPRA